MSFRTLRIEELDPIAVAGVRWRPIRHALGIRAFGVNAYSADADEEVIEDHTEEGSDHEEMYVVLAVGGKPGAGYDVSAWEWRFRAQPHVDAGEWEQGVALMRDGLAAQPGEASLLYDLACFEARLGRLDDAAQHLAQAVEARAELGAAAAQDPDLEPLRGRPDFPA